MDVVNKTATDPTSASASTNTNNNAGSSESSKITCEMSSEEILTQLANHGCKNITSRLDFTKCHQTPVFTGGFGDVYMGYLKSGDLVALKCSRLRVDTSEKKKQLKRSAHELYIWSKCRHSNILPLIGVAHYKDQLTMISPWMAYGSLTAYLTQHPEADRYDMCAQIAEGVAYLHEQGIVHGDIKGANIMVSKEHVPKIADFGTSVLRDYTLQFATTTKEQINTLRWAAPEVFKGITKLSTKGDVYSLGMTILEAFTGEAPYAESKDVAVMGLLYNNRPPTRPLQHFPIDDKRANLLWLLLHKCWAANPQDRPGPHAMSNKLRAMTNNARKYACFDESMGMAKILEQLDFHGCKNVTNNLVDGDRDCRDRATQLSVGTFSNIYLGVMRDGARVAIKSLRVAKIVFKGEILDDWNVRPHINIAHELYVRSQCVHPHILELIGATEFQGRLATVSPLIQHGNMYQFLEQKPEVNLCNMCSQLADAVTYLHSKDITHGGIQLLNVLVSGDHNIKLAGFSGAILYNSPVEFVGHRVENNNLLIWMAPELLEGGNHQSFKSDVYALGVAILQIVTRAENYSDSNGAITELKGHLRTTPPRRPKAHLPRNSKEANRLWDMLICCWEAVPDKRPTAAEIGNIMGSVSDGGLGKVMW